MRRAVTLSGVGLFTGEKVSIRLSPAEEGVGVVFKRKDLPGRPLLPAKLEYVKGTPRCTIIGNDGVFVQTVEHLLSAIKAYGIDNVLIEIDGPEVPIFDGSSAAFVEAIANSGVSEQGEEKVLKRLSAPVYWSQGDIHLVALPSDEYRICYSLNYPKSTILRSQYYSVVVNEQSFKTEIAESRTFCFYEEIAPLLEKGLIKGGGLENAVIIKEDRVINPEGVRYPDEMVRHKILDLIGDLSLIEPFVAHIIAIRSGHTSNVAFAKVLLNNLEMGA